MNHVAAAVIDHIVSINYRLLSEIIQTHNPPGVIFELSNALEQIPEWQRFWNIIRDKKIPGYGEDWMKNRIWLQNIYDLLVRDRLVGYGEFMGHGTRLGNLEIMLSHGKFLKSPFFVERNQELGSENSPRFFGIDGAGIFFFSWRDTSYPIKMLGKYVTNVNNPSDVGIIFPMDSAFKGGYAVGTKFGIKSSDEFFITASQDTIASSTDLETKTAKLAEEDSTSLPLEEAYIRILNPEQADLVVELFKKYGFPEDWIKGHIIYEPDEQKFRDWLSTRPEAINKQISKGLFTPTRVVDDKGRPTNYYLWSQLPTRFNEQNLAERVDERIDPETDCLKRAWNLFPVYAADNNTSKPCPVWERLVVRGVEKGERWWKTILALAGLGLVSSPSPSPSPTAVPVTKGEIEQKYQITITSGDNRYPVAELEAIAAVMELLPAGIAQAGYGPNGINYQFMLHEDFGACAQHVACGGPNGEVKLIIPCLPEEMSDPLPCHDFMKVVIHEVMHQYQGFYAQHGLINSGYCPDSVPCTRQVAFEGAAIRDGIQYVPDWQTQTQRIDLDDRVVTNLDDQDKWLENLPNLEAFPRFAEDYVFNPGYIQGKYPSVYAFWRDEVFASREYKDGVWINQ